MDKVKTAVIIGIVAVAGVIALGALIHFGVIKVTVKEVETSTAA